MYLHSIKSTDSRLVAARYFFPKSEPVVRYRFYHGRMSEVIDIDKRRSMAWTEISSAKTMIVE